ncbi:MAG: NADH-quinone oxidoreductase subunit C [Candidatus Syntropharchaeia archaeon]
MEEVRVKREKLLETCRSLRDKGFDYLECISGVDYKDRFEVVYILGSYSGPQHVMITTELPKEDPVIPSVTSIWIGADWHEREVYDMFGIIFKEHPRLSRILLPDSWEGYPLRKEYPIDREQEVSLTDETGEEICQI